MNYLPKKQSFPLNLPAQAGYAHRDDLRRFRRAEPALSRFHQCHLRRQRKRQRRQPHRRSGLGYQAHLRLRNGGSYACIYLTEDDALRTLDELKKAGIENILALRGDETPGRERAHVFEHASDLVAFIKRNAPEFNVIGACYPEGHTEAQTMAADIRNLKTKVDAGASELISQLFFDNATFYRFLERCEIAGISVPIEAGIMPVTNKKQIERMVSLCGATLPVKFQRAIAKYGDNAEAMRDIGIAYAIDQIADLLANGVDGIHVYTMNNPYIAKKITEAVKNLL